MAQVKATAERTISAPVEQVWQALADYTTVRPTLLTEQFSEYEVRAGGVGAGTTAHWKLAATSKRVRDCLVEVTEPAEHQLVERDTNSSMVTTWTVRPSGKDNSAVSVETTWNGAGGVGGFFEKTFAPGGLRRIYDGVLANLDRTVRA
ncbi:MAG TPA: SRPBCC family protein [Pseudonocardiaceae bacterium]|nr:SRPBCC family protein [Pseudonocardiaceae bacterium]